MPYTQKFFAKPKRAQNRLVRPGFIQSRLRCRGPAPRAPTEKAVHGTCDAAVAKNAAWRCEAPEFGKGQLVGWFER